MTREHVSSPSYSVYTYFHIFAVRLLIIWCLTTQHTRRPFWPLLHGRVVIFAWAFAVFVCGKIVSCNSNPDVLPIALGVNSDDKGLI
jgi:hypothetical protein